MPITDSYALADDFAPVAADSLSAGLPTGGVPADVLAAGGSAADSLSGFSAWTVTIMETLGPAGVGFMVFLDNIFPPIPSELVLPLAGFTSSQGQMNIVAAIVFATIGSVVGAVLLWALGKWIGIERIARIAVKMPLVDVDDVHNTVAWFDKHGDKAVFFGRMIPIFRSSSPSPRACGICDWSNSCC